MCHNAPVQRYRVREIGVNDNGRPDGIPENIVPLVAYCWQRRHKKTSVNRSTVESTNKIFHLGNIAFTEPRISKVVRLECSILHRHLKNAGEALQSLQHLGLSQIFGNECP